MRSVNKVILIGNVGSDPEVRTVGNGTKVATLSLATSRSWNGANGEKQEKTEWHRLVLWNGKSGNGLASIAESYVKKGSPIYIEGEIEYRQWDDKEGKKRYSTEIRVKDLQLLGSKGDGASRPASQSSSSAPTPDFPEASAADDHDLPF